MTIIAFFAGMGVMWALRECRMYAEKKAILGEMNKKLAQWDAEDKESAMKKEQRTLSYNVQDLIHIDCDYPYKQHCESCGACPEDPHGWICDKKRMSE